MEQKEDPGRLETYAIVEVMGHSRFAGYVQQVPMGGAAMIRIDVPEVPVCEEQYESWDYDSAPPKKVMKTRQLAGSPGFTKFLGISSIFSITPCSKEMALEAVRQFRSAPVTLLEIPARKMLVAPSEDRDDDEDDEYRNV